MKPRIPFIRLISLLCDTFDNIQCNADFEDSVALINDIYASLCEFRCCYRAKLEKESACMSDSDDDLPF